jgi:lipopolysaccharide export system permease protein
VVLREIVASARNEKDPEDYSRMRGTTTIGESSLVFEVNDLFQKRSKRVRYKSMTFGQLILERERHYAAGDEAEGMKASLALSNKAATAAAVLALTVLAVPLGIRVSRKETSANLGLALVLVMSYYFLTIVVSWLEKIPALRPDLLMFGPPLLFLGLGAWLFSRAERT